MQAVLKLVSIEDERAANGSSMNQRSILDCVRSKQIYCVNDIHKRLLSHSHITEAKQP